MLGAGLLLNNDRLLTSLRLMITYTVREEGGLEEVAGLVKGARRRRLGSLIELARSLTS